MKRRTFLSAAIAWPVASWTFRLPSTFLLDTLDRRAARLRPQRMIRRIAFGSCAYDSGAQPIWDAIATLDPDLFVFLGDNVYVDSEDPRVFREKYAALGSEPHFAKFRSRVPVAATWDDHDYGTNDGGAEYPMKMASKEFFLEFFEEPGVSERRSRPGVYTSYLLGPPGRRVQLILLDLRWFRSPLARGVNCYVPNPDPSATMLGDAQWRWVEEQLLVPAEVRILASSTQFVSSEHPYEKWENFPIEKRRMLDLLDRTNASNLVIISGDMHWGELSMERTPGGLAVYDVTSSGLTRFDQGWNTPNSKRLAFFDAGVNFGSVAIDWDRKPIRVSLEVRDMQGIARIAKKIALESHD